MYQFLVGKLFSTGQIHDISGDSQVTCFSDFHNRRCFSIWSGWEGVNFFQFEVRMELYLHL